MALQQLRKAKGLTLKGLAEISGVNYQKIWQIENGVIKSENITLKTAQKLAQALGCTPEDLLANKENVQN